MENLQQHLKNVRGLVSFGLAMGLGSVCSTFFSLLFLSSQRQRLKLGERKQKQNNNDKKLEALLSEINNNNKNNNNNNAKNKNNCARHCFCVCFVAIFIP